MKRTLLLALIPLALLGACQRTLGPDEAEFTYRNEQNSFAKVQIDGDTVGPALRPSEVRSFALAKATPHTVVVLHGNYIAGSAGFTVYHEEFQLVTTDPPFTLRWNDGNWRRADQP